MLIGRKSEAHHAMQLPLDRYVKKTVERRRILTRETFLDSVSVGHGVAL